MRFCELKEKDVVNRCDCKRLGKVCDLILDERKGCICCQIGPDIILVEVCEEDVLCPRKRAGGLPG